MESPGVLASNCASPRHAKTLTLSPGVPRTSSPGPRLCVPHACATRLTASLAFRVNTISFGLAAPMKSATCRVRGCARQWHHYMRFTASGFRA